MTVNEAVLALMRPKPDLAQLDGEPVGVLAAAQTAVDAPAGLGTIASYATEVALPATGTWSNPGRGAAQADIVITAPEDGVLLLFVEEYPLNASATAPATGPPVVTTFCQLRSRIPSWLHRTNHLSQVIFQMAPLGRHTRLVLISSSKCEHP
ncbi:MULTISPECIES: hypothetical protein [Streptomyces]|uniref:Uncharacterized protein n=1 Tax=Streptomyces eurythermus TaxID=42237 RepID=A0ABW6YZ96_9ACTN|nr:hypothetical protein [Streptomyces sp. DSM 40868]QIS75506.1 hypothetical protein HB370_40865 [Streptomyces sp. DSM 40868]